VEAQLTSTEAEDAADPVAAVASGGPVRSPPAGTDAGYKNLLSFIVSNAIAGEIMAVENYSEMVQLMPDVRSKIETVTQAREECKHIQLLAKLGSRLDFRTEKRIVEPQWLAIRKHFSAAVASGNLARCLIIQDLMTESMAIVLYRILAGEADTDAVTAGVAQNILRDEIHHLGIGTERLRQLMSEDKAAVNDALVWAHHRVMPELFAMVSTSCHFLCDELQVDCGSLQLSQIATDIDTIRAKALDRYVETLDEVGFAPSTVNPLVASMSSYGGMVPAAVGMGGGTCWRPTHDA
jgi:fatty aldehyde decarbonylase